MDNEFLQDRPAEAIAFAAASVEGDGFRTIRLTPDGSVRSTNGTFAVNAEGCALAVEAFQKHGVDLPIDFEHQTMGGEYSAPDGRAPAAGWISKIWREAGRGLMCLVKWTDEAREAIRTGKYRYISPVLSIRKADMLVVGLHSAALTNKPAIAGTLAVAASDRTNQAEIAIMANEKEASPDVGVTLGQIAGELGVEDAGTKDTAALLAAILEAVRELKGGDESSAEVASAVRARLELPADAGVAEVTVAMALVESEGAATVAAAESERTAKAMVDDYIACGKINPNDEGALTAAMSLARENPDRLSALMRNAADLRPPQGRTKAPNPAVCKRDQVIRMALSEYAADERLASSTSREAFAQMKLRDAAFPKLEDGELARFV